MNSKKASADLQKTQAADAVDAGLDTYLRAQAIVDAINANMPKGSTLQPIPKNYVFKKQDRETVSVALLISFASSVIWWLLGFGKARSIVSVGVVFWVLTNRLLQISI